MINPLVTATRRKVLRNKHDSSVDTLRKRHAVCREEDFKYTLFVSDAHFFAKAIFVSCVRGQQPPSIKLREVFSLFFDVPNI